jgi:hypothetical protein
MDKYKVHITKTQEADAIISADKKEDVQEVVECAVEHEAIKFEKPIYKIEVM